MISKILSYFNLCYEMKFLGKNKIYIAFIVIITIGMISLLPILCKNLKYGLDLQGGFEKFVSDRSYRWYKKMNKEKINQTYKILSKRIDSLGVSEPEIIVEGNDKVRIKLAGVKNRDEARRQLSTIATLTFRDTEDNLLMTSDVLTSGRELRYHKMQQIIQQFLLVLKIKRNFMM